MFIKLIANGLGGFGKQWTWSRSQQTTAFAPRSATYTRPPAGSTATPCGCGSVCLRFVAGMLEGAYACVLRQGHCGGQW